MIKPILKSSLNRFLTLLHYIGQSQNSLPWQGHHLQFGLSRGSYKFRRTEAGEGSNVGLSPLTSLLYIDFCSFRYTPRSGLRKLCGNSSFGFLRALHCDFHSGCTSLHFYQKCFFSPTFFSSFTVVFLMMIMTEVSEL